MFQKPYSQFYDILNSDKPYEKEIHFVYEWAGRPKRIFDIGAGTGHYWKYYPKGTYVFGVDKSPSMASKKSLCADITKYKHAGKKFDCATALFDVLNYIPKHDWWKGIPLEKGGSFLFDVWDKKKVDEEGFVKTHKNIGGLSRTIRPLRYDGKSVDLKIEVSDGKSLFIETHTMYVHSEEDIVKACGEDFEIVGIRPTMKWQVWYKCKRR